MTRLWTWLLAKKPTWIDPHGLFLHLVAGTLLTLWFADYVFR